jgi:glutaryl-CoA dehydrogenase
MENPMSDTHTQEAKMPKALPKPNSDFYQTFQMLSEAEQAMVTKVREFMKASVAPIINDFLGEGLLPV